MRYRAAKELKFKELPCKILSKNTPVEKLKEYTITASCEPVVYEYPRKMTDYEIMCAGTFPQDYQCDGKIMWYVGMSVPPIMTAQISNQIYLQWLSKI